MPSTSRHARLSGLAPGVPPEAAGELLLPTSPWAHSGSSAGSVQAAAVAWLVCSSSACMSTLKLAAAVRAASRGSSRSASLRSCAEASALAASTAACHSALSTRMRSLSCQPRPISERGLCGGSHSRPRASAAARIGCRAGGEVEVLAGLHAQACACAGWCMAESGAQIQVDQASTARPHLVEAAGGHTDPDALAACVSSEHGARARCRGLGGPLARRCRGLPLCHELRVDLDQVLLQRPRAALELRMGVGCFWDVGMSGSGGMAAVAGPWR